MLAETAVVSAATVRAFEQGRRRPTTNNLSSIRRALEEANIEFIGGDRPGVRWASTRYVLEDGE